MTSANEKFIISRHGERNTAIHEKIRTYGCCACGRKQGIHMHHVRTRGAIGRVDEENVVPLCYICHCRVHSWGVETFAKRMKLDLKDIAIKLWKKGSEWHDQNTGSVRGAEMETVPRGWQSQDPVARERMEVRDDSGSQRKVD